MKEMDVYCKHMQSQCLCKKMRGGDIDSPETRRPASLAYTRKNKQKQNKRHFVSNKVESNDQYSRLSSDLYMHVNCAHTLYHTHLQIYKYIKERERERARERSKIKGTKEKRK